MCEGGKLILSRAQEGLPLCLQSLNKINYRRRAPFSTGVSGTAKTTDLSWL